MDNEKYSNYPLSISAILGLIEANDIAIPELQRPFVWKKTQVRDLIDSLYKGYPTGYIILWKIPNVYLKEAKERCMNTASEQTGLINDIDKFYANLETNCVPVEAIDMDFNSYDDFLEKRRKMMAAKIKKYYYSL